MRADMIDRRVIAALRLLDGVTGAPVRRPVAVSGEGLDLLRNQSGLYVIRAAPGLAAYTRLFEAPPAAPAVGSLPLTLRVSDPLGAYLPRLVRVAVPRDPRPERASQPDSLFRAVEAPLYPAPAARVEPGWAVLRASVRRQGAPLVGLAGALLRVEGAADSRLLGVGLSDGRGEALIAVWDIRAVMTGGAGPAVTTESLDVVVTAFVDPAALPPAGGPAPPPPDPDDLTARRESLRSRSASVAIASGRATAVRLEIDLL